MSGATSRVTVADLGEELKQTLTLYNEEVNEAINQASENAVKALVTKTKATAPDKTGRFRKNIAGKEIPKSKGANRGKTYVWYVKAPDYRLTHLLVHGHATKNGGRTKADPFLRNALDQVLPEYVKNVEEAIQRGNSN